jgi:hypothetical protein
MLNLSLSATDKLLEDEDELFFDDEDWTFGDEVSATNEAKKKKKMTRTKAVNGLKSFTRQGGMKENILKISKVYVNIVQHCWLMSNPMV